MHDDQNSGNYRKLEHLISYVVSPYLSSTGLRTKPLQQTVESKASKNEDSQEPSTVTEKVAETLRQSNKKPRPISVGDSLELQSKYSADRLHEAALQTGQNRRFTYTSGNLTDSSRSPVFGSSTSTVT